MSIAGSSTLCNIGVDHVKSLKAFIFETYLEKRALEVGALEGADRSMALSGEKNISTYLASWWTTGVNRLFGMNMSSFTIYILLDAHHVEIEFCKRVPSHHVPVRTLAHLQAFVPGMCAILVELPAAERIWFTSYAEKVLATSVTAKLTVLLCKN